MKKMNKKFVSVMATAALAAGVVAPVAPVATSSVSAAAGEIVATNVPSLSDKQGDVALGTVRVTIPAGTNLSNGDSVVVKLPLDASEDFAKNDTTVTDDTYKNFVSIPARFSGDDNGLLGDGNSHGSVFGVEKEADDRIKIKYIGGSRTLTHDGVFFINSGAVEMESGESGAQEVVLEASPNSAFPAGRVTVANVSANGEITISASSLDESNNKFTPTLHIAESVGGSFEEGDEVKFKLPAGFEWTDFRDFSVTYGDDVHVDEDNSGDFKVTIDEEELIVKYIAEDGTSEPTKIELKVDFQVEDESKAKEGDVIARVTSDVSSNVSEIKVGTYGEYGSSITAEDVETLISGKDEQRVAEFQIKETIGSSLVEGRTITITLPEGARWQEQYEADVEDIDNPNYSGIGSINTTEGLSLEFNGYTGTDKRTAKYTVKNTSSDDAGKITFRNVDVALASDFTGDLELEIDGSSGVSGSVVVAEVEPAVIAKADSIPNVIIGLNNQEGAEFTLTEAVAEGLSDDETGTVVLDLPDGVFFDATPDIEVTDGDLRISNVKRSSNDNQVTFTIESESTEPSEITVSDVKLRVDRTVPEGDIEIKVKGDAVAETDRYSDWDDNDSAAKVVVAKVATPAPKDTTAEVEFVIGSTTYTVNGIDRTADVAPFIENGRTYLPIRFVAEAVGVSENNIIWNDAARTVTIIKGDRVVQLTIGSNILTVNGVGVPMDVNAFIRDDRTYLPISFVAQALGLNVEWDDAARTVTIN